MELVINKCYGGFGLSKKAKEMYKERKGITDKNFYDGRITRIDKDLVAIVKELGEEANGKYASLEIVNIPDDDDIQYAISDYDGIETVYYGKEMGEI